MGTEKKNTGHWDNVFSELNDDVMNNQEESPAEEAVSETAPAEEAESAKPKRGRKAAVKKRAVKKTAVKRGTRVPKGIEFLDSPDQIRLDLTVGAEKKRTAVRRRGRGKSIVSGAADLIEKAEEAERIQATETVRSLLAAQLGGLVQEKVQSETAENDSAEAAAKNTAAEAEPEKTAEQEKAETAAVEKTLTFDDFFGGETETLEISWGRPPKAVFAEEPVQEPAAEMEKEPVEESADSADSVSEEEPAPAEVKGGKISKKDAEALFAEQFSSSAAPAAGSAAKEEPKRRELTPADNDFWGIPDEPEISFTPKASKGSAFGAKTAPKAAKEAVKEEPAPSAVSEPVHGENRGDNRNDRGGRGRRRENDFVPAESAFIPMEEKNMPESESFSGPRRDRNGRDRGRRGRREIPMEENSAFAAPENGSVKDWEPRQEQDPQRREQPMREMPEREMRQEREPRPERNFQNRENGGMNREMPGRGRRMREPFDRSANEPMRGDVMCGELMHDEMPQNPIPSQPERMSRPSDEEIEWAFPSWQEAISQVIRFNIDRHKQRQGDHGPRHR